MGVAAPDAPARTMPMQTAIVVVILKTNMYQSIIQLSYIIDNNLVKEYC